MRLVVLILMGAMAAGAAPSTQVDIAAVIGRLAADEFADRQRAQDELVARGEEVREAVAEAMSKTKDEEVRTRLEAVLRKLDDDRELAATPITVHLTDASPQAVLDAIAKQAHVQFSAAAIDLAGPAISIDVEKKPFWLAMKELCGKASLNVRRSHDSTRMVIVREIGSPMAGPSVISGPFVVSVDSAQLSAWVPFANPAQANRDCSLQVSLFLEPRLKLVSGKLEIKKIVDENGDSLMRGGAIVAPPFDHECDYQWITQLRLASNRTSRRIALIQAEAHLLVQTEWETAEVGDIVHARNVERSVGPRRFRMNELVQNDHRYTLDMTLFRGDLNAEDWRNFGSPGTRVVLLDEQDKALFSVGGSASANAEEANYRQVFSTEGPGMTKEKMGAPVKLKWQLPLKVREVVLPVKFEDLPMP